MNLKAWIQGPNENVQDFILENGKIMATLSADERRNYVDLMLRSKEGGKKIVDKETLKIVRSKHNKNLYVVDLKADNKDVKNRSTAVLLLIDKTDGSNKIDEFSSLINETLSNTSTEVSAESLEELKKFLGHTTASLKDSFSDTKNIFIVCAILLALAAIIGYLNNK